MSSCLCVCGEGEVRRCLVCEQLFGCLEMLLDGCAIPVSVFGWLELCLHGYFVFVLIARVMFGCLEKIIGWVVFFPLCVS